MKIILSLLLCLSFTAAHASMSCKGAGIRLMAKLDNSRVLDGKYHKDIKNYELPSGWTMKMGFYDQIYIDKDTKDLTIQAVSKFKGKKFAEVKAKAKEFKYFNALIGRATQWPAVITFTVLQGKKKLCQQEMKIEGFALK